MFYEEHQEAYLQRGDTVEHGKMRENQHKQDQRESLGRTKDGGCTKRPHLAPYCAPIFQLSVAQTCREVYQSWITYKLPRTEGNLPENHRTMEWLLDARNPVKVDWRAENIREEFVGVAYSGRWRCQARHIPETECAAVLSMRGTFTQCAAYVLNVPGFRMYAPGADKRRITYVPVTAEFRLSQIV
ncbi:hypothetical protein B0H13DRAFT_2277045 [Mycena leptocephala]|nr:hypothetical protein B0H13DRAFT_2277045 [Mycena leptocephala]